MPSCRPEVIPAIVYKAMTFKPKTILDVGAGCGKWGCLLYEYLRYWCDMEPEIDAVEPFAAYKTPAWGFYRNVYEQDVLDVMGLLDKYDLVLMIDVIEHLEREKGEQVLNAVAKHYLVSTPAYWSPQGASFGNERERHVSRWYPADFYDAKIVQGGGGRNFIIGWK